MNMARASYRTVLLLGSLWCAFAAAAASARPSQVVFLTRPTSAVQGSTVQATAVVSRAGPPGGGILRRGPRRAVRGGPVQAAVVVPRAVPGGGGIGRRGRAGRAAVAPVVRPRPPSGGRLPRTAAPGRWTIAVTCGSAGSASGSFDVTRRITQPAAVTVAVEQAGFAVGGTQLGYGVVLRDTSSTRDAVGVTVTVNVVDAANRVLRTDTSRISGIPAGETYYFGGDVFLDAGAAPASLQVTARAESDQAKR